MKLAGHGRGLTMVVVTLVVLLIIVLGGLAAVLADRARYPVAKLLRIPLVPPDDPARANAAPRGDVARFFGPDSYPDAARDAGEQGRVGVMLMVAPDGTVDTCMVAESSGSRTLDEQTCRIAVDDMRFDPARDSRGRAIASNYRLRVRWQLPSE